MTTTTNTPAADVTREDIIALRDEARASGQGLAVIQAERALAGDTAAWEMLAACIRAVRDENSQADGAQ